MPIAGQLIPKGQRTRERIVEAAAGPAHHRRDRAEALPSAVASQVAKLATWASAMSSATSSGAGLR